MSRETATVVLVHGLWMQGIVFWPLRLRLARHGFAVRAFSYPSVRRGLAENADALARFIAGIDTRVIHIVGHSLGGLVTVAMLAGHPDPRIRRVVMMGSPYAGSHCANVLLQRRGLSAVVGHSIQDWMTLPRPRPPTGVEIGIIAGSRGMGLGRLIPGLPQPNDGVVAVAETRLAGARDSITLPVGHTRMLLSAACAEQAMVFLRTGRFAHG